MSKLKDQKKQPQEKKGFDFTYVFIGIAILLVIGFVYLVFFVPSQGGGTAENLVSSNDPFKGPAEAKVVFVEFSDFECPACGFAYPTVKRLSQDYADSVKIVYKDFPLTSIHPFAQKAAEAGQCALDQGKFWEMHDKMFENQQVLGVDALKQYAQDIGLDTAQFNSCLDSGQKASIVAQDVSLGLQVGVNATPTFYINGVKYSNLSYDQFKAIIDAELAK